MLSIAKLIPTRIYDLLQSNVSYPLSKSEKRMQVGIWKTDDILECVWFEPQTEPPLRAEQAKMLRINLHEESNSTLFLQIPITKIDFIGCIMPNLIWSKTLILPQMLNAQECEQQCYFILEKELPIPINELWFDYRISPLQQGMKLEIFAIKKYIAQAYQHKYLSYQFKVLDILPHALLRAFEFFIGETQMKKNENTLYLYHDEQACLALYPQMPQLQIVQTKGSLHETYVQFKQQFDEDIQQIYIYSQQHETLDNAITIKTELPFIALGNALWQAN